MKSIYYAAFAILTFFVTHATAMGQVNVVHPRHRVQRAAKDPAMIAAAKDARQAHITMKSALPIYEGHRVLAMKLCGLSDRDIREGLTGIPSAPPVDFTTRKPLKLDKNSEKELMKYSTGQIQASNAQMQRAIPMLQAALQALSQAAGDYGGYRTQAANSINQALHEIQICLQLRGGAGTINP
ncbi:MAG TPA: hypothetical protein VMI31_09730 [Fimbriimonadaceae bacterium]|nr:hypothetical protein [Fimbriimonadaceae bacterium]